LVEALAIIAWRNDVGAYLFDSVPPNIKIDGQDLMNLYNLHRFRDTKANFQFIQTKTTRIASFYSGGYNNPFVGKPNYAVALLLSQGENPDNYEKGLRIVTNNVLVHLDDDDFTGYFNEIFDVIKQGKIDEIKIDRKNVSAPAPKEIHTTETIGMKLKTEEKDIFDDLLATVQEKPSQSGTFDADAFKKSLEESAAALGSDPFGGTSNAADPFGGGGSNASDPFANAETKTEDLFSGDPFAKIQPARPMGVQPAQKVIKASQLINDLNSIDQKIPKPPSDSTPDKMVGYLEQKVGLLEKKISILSQISNQLQMREKELEEKNDLIGKLLLLLS